MSDKPILIAYDGSPGAEHAIQAAASLFGPRPARVVNVWSSVLNSGPAIGGIPVYLSDLDPKLEDGAQKTAEEGARIASGCGFEADPMIVQGASPWHGIVETADELDVAAIVVGARGMSRVKSALLGSTSNGVLHHTGRPVLVIRRPDEEGEP